MKAITKKCGITVAISLLWTLLIASSLFWNVRILEEQVEFLAETEARSNWEKDQSFRQWATQHGGLYVRPDERTPPNPYLAHLPNRDIETTNGEKLTLMNPAYMMRQITKEYEELYGVKGHITAQVLLNPLNKADPWELDALKRFDAGEKEVIELSEIDGERYLRLMRPMVMEKGCEHCHGHLDFREGDIRGGVSVSIPLEPYYASLDSTIEIASASHAAVWVLGLLAIGYFSHLAIKRTERLRHSEIALARSQKMDALGKLTGGIAHDFNNILVVLTGYAELLELETKDKPELNEYVHEIHAATDRAKNLTEKLLRFSRSNSGQDESVDINRMLREDERMLSKVLTARIRLKLSLAEDLWSTWLDRSDLEDAILNMCINSLHAMPEGGELTLATHNSTLKRAEASQFGLAVGEYVNFSITDTGCGMDEATRASLFDPFFSTKGSEGTGLGMSQVYGFVKRAGGSIVVQSQPGHGTSISLLFPRYKTNHSTGIEDGGSDDSDGNEQATETILVVDDERTICDLAERIFNSRGYRVLKAENAEEALEILKGNSIDLLFTDVIMPGMDGHQLAAETRRLYPKIAIQLASGFDDRHENRESTEFASQLLRKPYNTKLLLETVALRLKEARDQRPS